MTELAVVALAVAGLVALAGVVAGIARYRQVMRRRWPAAPSAESDDDW